MKTRLRGPLAGAMAAALVLSSYVPAHAQLDAREAPVVTGPLIEAGEGQKCRSSRYEVDGNVVARAKICLFLYSFDPEMEDDDDRDYGVMWAQTNVDTSDGWCAFTVHTEVYVPSDMPLHAKVPRAQKIAQRKKVRWKMTVDANGHAQEDATVKKRLTLYPRSLSRSRRADEKDEGTDVVRLTWRGQTARKLGFVSGFETSWPADGGAPDQVPFRVEYPIRQC